MAMRMVPPIVLLFFIEGAADFDPAPSSAVEFADAAIKGDSTSIQHFVSRSFKGTCMYIQQSYTQSRKPLYHKKESI